MWSEVQVLALAPDDAAAKAGRGLASPSHWATLGHDPRTVWGECRGSGAKPYQVQVDLGGPAFHCTCPSRKIPCKHVLGLLLMYASDLHKRPECAVPAWVAEWLAKRDERADKQAQKAAAPTTKTPEAEAKAAADQARRAEARERRVASGMEDLQLWLSDLVRQGLASLPGRPLGFWDEMAARMVDAQAPGAARRVRELGAVASSGEGWAERLLERLGLLYLLAESYGRLACLPEATQADVRSAIGWTVRQEEVLASDGSPGPWHVLGQYVYDEDQVRVKRTWLARTSDGRPALLLSFSRPGMPFDVSLVPGTTIDADLVYFPGAAPLRALVKEQRSSAAGSCAPSGHATAAAMLSAFADAVAANPWIEAYPAHLAAVAPFTRAGRFFVRDAEGRTLPAARSFGKGWTMLAISGGAPMDLFGEWDGAALLPLAARVGARYVAFEGL